MFEPLLFARALVAWFRAAQRAMPWRAEENVGNPYRILVSEVMLQQTTVAAVTPFFERFIARFPTVEALASAAEEDVLACWAGLGYYARARNLQSAARVIVNEHGGEFPADFERILALPGVGRYTAGAVASIAFEQRAPIVDANVARVLARVLLVEGDLKKRDSQQKLWDAATRIVEIEEVAPREVNPALMELGALVCTPRAPRCAVCPVSACCAAFQSGRQDEIPHASPRRAPTLLFDTCALGRDPDGRILLRQRPDEPGVWWRGMWELPRTTRRAEETAAEALMRLGEELGVKWKVGGLFSTLKHGVTRFHIELECYEIEVESVAASPTLAWFDLTHARTLALPSTMKTLLQRAENARGGQLSLL